jgi:hypothetical protein
MKVLCIRGHEDLLKEGEEYTVVALTSNGNYFLEEVEIPEGYTSFSSDRFAIIGEVDLGWDVEMEEAYWAEQSAPEYSA